MPSRVPKRRIRPQAGTERDWTIAQWHSPPRRTEQEPQVIAAGCRYLYEEEALAIQRSFRAQLEAAQIGHDRSLERRLESQRRRHRTAIRRLQEKLSAARLSRASAQGGLTMMRRRVQVMTASEPFSRATILTVADHIASGLSFRGACRLAHLSITVADKALTLHRAGKAVGRQAEFAAAVEEALGKNEALWVDSIRDAVSDKIVDLSPGQSLRRGDAKVAMGMLSRQHAETYGDRLALTASRAPEEDLDLSSLSDEELGLLQAAESIRERLSRGAAPVAALVADLAEPEPEPEDAEVDD